MDLSLPVKEMTQSYFLIQNQVERKEASKAKGEDFVESYTFLEPNPRLGLESEQRIRNKISFELNETALAAASVMNILLCY